MWRAHASGTGGERRKCYHVEEEGLVSSFHGSIDICSSADNEWALASQLQGYRLDTLCGILHDDFADFCASSEGHLYICWVS